MQVVAMLVVDMLLVVVIRVVDIHTVPHNLLATEDKLVLLII